MVKLNYWTSEDNELIRMFYYCYTATTSASTRNRIFSQLQPKLNYLVNNAVNSNISSWSNEDKEEARADVMMKIWQVLSTKLNEHKIKGVLNFLWVVANNKIISITRQHLRVKKPQIEYNSNMYHVNYNMFFEQYYGDYDNIINYDFINGTDTDDYDETEEVDPQKLQKQIYAELDRKIIEQEKVRTNAFYLMLLKEYLQNNDCDASGFQSYILDKLQISKENFYQINYTLGLKSGVFKDKKNKITKI